MDQQPTALEWAIVRAIAAENTGKRARSSFCKCNRVLLLIAQAQEPPDPLVAEWLMDETLALDEDLWARLEAFYDPFVAAVQAGRVCEGQGNFGGADEYGDWAPAHPKFLEVRLTGYGMRLAQTLGH